MFIFQIKYQNEKFGGYFKSPLQNLPPRQAQAAKYSYDFNYLLLKTNESIDEV
jgi:hypothetical protein